MPEFSALTTNNTLLNKEIQKGIYDDLIKQAGSELADTFHARVSVDLHTATAHDIEKAVWYAQRFHAVSPDSFIVKFH